MIKLNIGPKLRQYAIVVTVNFSMLWTGMALGWTSPNLVKLANATETVLHEPMSENDGSWLVSSSFLASIFVGPVSSYLLNSIGRKYSVIIASIPHIIAGLIFVFAKEVWILILARVIIGFALVLSMNVSPSYAAEVASKEIRGSLGTILEIFSCLGITVMLVIGPFVSYLALNLIYTSVIVLTAIPMLFLPDSPYYLHSKGRTDEALEILIKLRGSELIAKQEIAEYEVAINDAKLSHLSLFKDPIFLKTVLLVMIFATITQLSGANALGLYLQPILNSTKTNLSSEVASAVIGALKLVASLLTASITDRFGRKPILFWSYLGMAIGLVGFGVCFKISNETKQMYNFINYIPLICLAFTTYCNSAGQGSLFFAVTAELFQGPSRALGVSIAFITGSTFTFITSKYLKSFLALVGAAAGYWSFAAICILGGLFVCFCLPETKGKTFAEIQKALGRKTS